MLRRAGSVVAVAVALTLVGCSSDSKPQGAASSSSSPSTSTTTTTTATTAPTTTLPPAPAPTPQEAATAFVDAWRNGDQAAAAAIAVPDAVAAVFAAGDPGHVQSRGCNSPPLDSPVLCVYRTDAGELQVRMQQGPDGWYVDQAIVSSA